MSLIDAESNFKGGLIPGKKALTPSVFELSTVFCFMIRPTSPAETTFLFLLLEPKRSQIELFDSE